MAQLIIQSQLKVLKQIFQNIHAEILIKTMIIQMRSQVLCQPHFVINIPILLDHLFQADCFISRRCKPDLFL